MKTLVLGLGNPILGDDSVGLRAAALVRQQLPADSDVEVDEDYWGGLRLMERLIGYDRAIILDAICTGRHAPGSVLHLRPDDFPTQHSASAHDLSLPAALQLAQELHVKVPWDITLIAVEAEQVLEFADHCTPAVEAALPEVVQAVLAALGVPSDHLLAAGCDRAEYAAQPPSSDITFRKLEVL